MKPIVKSDEPESLAEHRCKQFADYDNYEEKDDLRASLVAEQGGICCYCMQRIGPTEARMKIEHWLCQDANEGKQLEYRNLLGACLGGMGKPRKLQHCDTFKGNLSLSRNPAKPNPRVDRDLKYLTDGTIISGSSAFNDELNDVLNLNLPVLKNNRKAVIDGLKEWAERSGNLRREDIRRELAEWNTIEDGVFQEYAQVAVYWLNKRLRRA
jgi:uncharacterized protein (TIGR02646 family)